MQSNGTLLLHDADRDAYKPIFKYYDLVGSADTLMALRPRSGLTPQQFTDYVQYLDDMR